MAGLFELIVPNSSNENNIILNPSLETGTTLWTTGNTLAQSDEQAWRGLYSAKITYGANATLLEYSLTLSTTTTYYARAVVYVPSTWVPAAGSYIRLDFVNYVGATVTYPKRFVVGTDAYGEWILLKTKVVTAADGAGVLRVNVDAGTNGVAVYVDAVKVSLTDSLYFDGDTLGCYWTGTPHASLSVCPLNVRAQGVPTNFDSFGIYFGAPSNTDMAPLSFHSRSNPFLPGAEHYRTKTQPSSFMLPGEIVGTSYPDLHSKRTTLQKALNKDLLYPEQPFVIRYNGNSADNPTYYEARLQGFSFGRDGFTDKGVLKFLAERNPHWYEEGDRATVLDRQDTLAVDYVLGYENSAFTAMQGGGGGGTGTVLCMVMGGDGRLYMGGSFDNWDGQGGADRMVVYDPSTGTYTVLMVTGANGNLRAMLRLPNGQIVLAGDFTSIGGAAHNRIVLYTPGSPGSLTAMGTGANGIVRALCQGSDGKIYAGGDFTDMGGVANTNYIAYWDGTWHAMDTGANAEVYALVTHPTQGHLIYAGGNFTQVGSGPTTVGRVARWDAQTSTWIKIGFTGMNGQVTALAFRGKESILYAGGAFTTVEGGTVNKMAGINTDHNHWVDMDGGVSGGNVLMLAWSNLYQHLLVGGTFSQAGNSTLGVDGLVLWRAGQWAHPGISVPAGVSVHAYTETPYGNYYLGFASTGNATLSGAATTITNAGGVNAYPILYLKVSGAGTVAHPVSLSNLSTGLNIYFEPDFNILEGQTAILDLTPGNKRFYLRDNFAVETEVTGEAIAPNSDFVDWALKPGPNLVQLRVDDETGSPTVTAWLTYRRQYATYDGEV